MLARTPSRARDTGCTTKHDNRNSASCQPTLTCIIVETITQFSKYWHYYFKDLRRPSRTLPTVMFRGTPCIKA